MSPSNPGIDPWKGLDDLDGIEDVDLRRFTVKKKPAARSEENITGGCPDALADFAATMEAVRENRASSSTLWGRVRRWLGRS